MIDYREQVSLALRAAAVSPPASYSWFGRRSRAAPTALGRAPRHDVTRAYLVRELQGVLYRCFYCTGAPVPVGHAAVPSRSDPAFVDALSRSNSGRGGWQSGWRIERVEGGNLVVAAPDGVRVRVSSAECRPVCGNRAVSVRRPKEHRYVSPGFYTAFGDAEPSTSADDTEVRIYFHVIASAAVRVVACCTRVLNRAGVPFILKVLDNPAGFVRCDAAVLYLGKHDFGHAREALRAIVGACETHLRADVPAFTKPLADGVAVGEHRSGVGASFGTCRCRLVAEAIVDAHEGGMARLVDRTDAVARRFAGIGLDIRLPYLAPMSADRYVL